MHAGSPLLLLLSFSLASGFCPLLLSLSHPPHPPTQSAASFLQRPTPQLNHSSTSTDLSSPREGDHSKIIANVPQRNIQKITYFLLKISKTSIDSFPCPFIRSCKLPARSNSQSASLSTPSPFLSSSRRLGKRE
ncbi:hypothetical protein HOY80DRAFT_93526 [Tuber brumale]|nr:hypothetical protein HOY80DRAFT_93526 [Tuber brumale]